MEVAAQGQRQRDRERKAPGSPPPQQGELSSLPQTFRETGQSRESQRQQEDEEEEEEEEEDREK